MSGMGMNAGYPTTSREAQIRSYSHTSAEGRRVVRQRKVSTKIASITDVDLRNAASARLEALETDHDTAPTFQDSDEEFVLEDSDEGSLGTYSTAV